MERYSDPHDPMLESYTAQSYMAAQTKQIKHGVMVTGGLYRYPGILVKTVTTLDVLSGGRAYFGIGAGWYEREAYGLGVPFPPTGERLARLDRKPVLDARSSVPLPSAMASPFRMAASRA